jgi:hypothetical protein
MRNIRNRIVHDHLPEQTAQMFGEIANTYGPELEKPKNHLSNWPNINNPVGDEITPSQLLR